MKLKYSKSAAFVTEPNIKGLTTQKGVVENVSLNDLTTEFQTIHRQVFDDVDPNYKSDDFLKVKSGTHDKLIRKSDLTEYKIGADFVRAYDVDPAKKIFVIQTTNEIAVYKNGKLDLSRHFEHANDIQIVGFSEKENAYLGYDAKLGKLFSTMVIWDSIQIGPDADITYFKPKMVGPSTILFQKSNGRFYRWGIQTNPADKSRLYVAIVDAATANGVSGNPKFVAGYNNKLEKWEFKEIVMGDKK